MSPVIVFAILVTIVNHCLAMRTPSDIYLAEKLGGDYIAYTTHAELMASKRKPEFEQGTGYSWKPKDVFSGENEICSMESALSDAYVEEKILNIFQNTLLSFSKLTFLRHEQWEIGAAIAEKEAKLYLVIIAFPADSVVMVLDVPMYRTSYAKVWKDLHSAEWNFITYDTTRAAVTLASTNLMNIAPKQEDVILKQATLGSPGKQYYWGYSRLLGKLENISGDSLDNILKEKIQEIQTNVSKHPLFSDIQYGNYVFGMITSLDIQGSSYIPKDSDLEIYYVLLQVSSYANAWNSFVIFDGTWWSNINYDDTKAVSIARKILNQTEIEPIALTEIHENGLKYFYGKMDTTQETLANLTTTTAEQWIKQMQAQLSNHELIYDIINGKYVFGMVSELDIETLNNSDSDFSGIPISSKLKVSYVFLEVFLHTTITPYDKLWRKYQSGIWLKTDYDSAEAVKVLSEIIPTVDHFGSSILNEMEYDGRKCFYGFKTFGKVVDTYRGIVNDVIENGIQKIQEDVSCLKLISEIESGNYVFGMFTSIDEKALDDIVLESPFQIFYIFYQTRSKLVNKEFAELWKRLREGQWTNIIYDVTGDATAALGTISQDEIKGKILTETTYKAKKCFYGSIDHGIVKHLLNSCKDSVIMKGIQNLQADVSRHKRFSEIINGKYVFGLTTSIDRKSLTDISEEQTFTMNYVFLERHE